MAKTIVKELIILLLISIAILLILGIVLYDYMPNNKVIPKVKVYEKSAEMQEAITNAKAEEGTKVVLTYEITNSDLNMYERTKQYVAGKDNPFAEYTEEVKNQNTPGNTTTNGNSTSVGTGNSTSSNSSTNTQNSGTLFENGTTK